MMFDFEAPKALLQRYDSYSSSSGSNKSSLSSSLSFDAVTPRLSLAYGNEQSEKHRNISITSKDSSRNRTKRRANRTQEFIFLDNSDQENNCIFCSSKVHERQYYMWQSAYTKSSFCSRCSEDSNSLNYISYWGTSSYQSGSWRKRYKEGTGSDIDLAPLLQVLDRIDRMDTSICGYTYSTNKITDTQTSNSNKMAQSNQEMTNIEADFKLSERRKRRLRNRKSLSNFDNADNITDNNGNVSDNTTSELHGENLGQPQNDILKSIATENYEISQSEDLDVIEPLLYEQANESIGQFDNDVPDGDKFYLDFIAGLSDDDYIRKRCSSMRHDRVNVGGRMCITNNQVAAKDANECENMANDNKRYENANNDNKTLNSKRKITKEEPLETKYRSEDSNSTERMRKEILSENSKPRESQNQTNVPLVYKQKRKSFSQPRCGRRYSKPVVETFPFDDDDDDRSTHDIEQLSFTDKKRMFEKLQSINSSIENVSHGKYRSNYLKGSECEKDNISNRFLEKRSSGHNTNGVSEEIDCDENKTIDLSSTFENRSANIEIEEVDKTNNSSSEWVETSTFTNVSVDSNSKDPTQTNSKSNDAINNTNASTSSNSTDDMTNSPISEHSSYNASISDKSISILNTPNTSQNLNTDVSIEMSFADDNDQQKAMRRRARIDSIASRNHYKPRRTRERHNTEKSMADDESSDVPHVERLKKKLGRVKNDDDDIQTIENEETIELDVSDNEHKELSWRTRGYNVDFFMSRQSVTGSEILERYNRAISRRRQRKKVKATPFPYGTSNYLDKLVSGSEQVSRKQSVSVCKPRQSISEPLTRTASFKRRDSTTSNSSDKATYMHSGISPKALEEALNRAAACSNRLDERLQSQLNDSSCDSSS